jgi:hypothetical protein
MLPPSAMHFQLSGKRSPEKKFTTTSTPREFVLCRMLWIKEVSLEEKICDRGIPNSVSRSTFCSSVAAVTNIYRNSLALAD